MRKFTKEFIEEMAKTIREGTYAKPPQLNENDKDNESIMRIIVDEEGHFFELEEKEG